MLAMGNQFLEFLLHGWKCRLFCHLLGLVETAFDIEWLRINLIIIKVFESLPSNDIWGSRVLVASSSSADWQTFVSRTETWPIMLKSVEILKFQKQSETCSWINNRRMMTLLNDCVQMLFNQELELPCLAHWATIYELCTVIRYIINAHNLQIQSNSVANKHRVQRRIEIAWRNGLELSKLRRGWRRWRSALLSCNDIVLQRASILSNDSLNRWSLLLQHLATYFHDVLSDVFKTWRICEPLRLDAMNSVEACVAFELHDVLYILAIDRRLDQSIEHNLSHLIDNRNLAGYIDASKRPNLVHLYIHC